MRVMRSISRIVIIALPVLAGCGREEATFSHRAEINDLMPAAQAGVEQIIDDHFGTPVDMVAWERLPIHFHGASGTFGEALPPDADGRYQQFLVDLNQENLDIADGQELLWLSGKYLGAESNPTVASYDAKTKTLTLADKLEVPPDAGDRFAIFPGGVLIHGRLLYAEHCQHCHGVSGDGQGATARYLKPLPRDYRLGKFKFTSTVASSRAVRDDLSRIIEDGIPGTYMPSFKLLKPDEVQAIVEYVLWLSMRGELERKAIGIVGSDYAQSAVDDAVTDAKQDGQSAADVRNTIQTEFAEYISQDFPEEFAEEALFLAEAWNNAELPESNLVPHSPRVDDTPESRARGRELYLSAKAKCATCHGEGGRGDGPQTLAVQKNPLTNTDYPEPGLFDDWGNPISPRNLRTGIYRGGRRPVDLYRRLHAGIKGTPMPAFGTVLTDEELWDIVNYVTNLPFEMEQPGDGTREAPAAAKVARSE